MGEEERKKKRKREEEREEMKKKERKKKVSDGVSVREDKPSKFLVVVLLNQKKHR